RGAGLPTPAGTLVYKRARILIDGAAGLAREMKDFDEAAEQELRVGASDTNALYFLPDRVRTFSERMPNTRLALVTRSTDEIGDAIQRGELDLGIVTLPIEGDALESRELFSQRLALVVPKGHPLSERRRVSLARLARESFVLLQRETRTGKALWSHLEAEGFLPQVIMDSGSFEVIKRYVGEGIGLSFLPEIVVTEMDRARLSMVRIDGLPAIRIGAIWRRGAYRTKAARAFVKTLLDA
ncbi:MAG TPA: LysR family transcriptional regulator substrate-binding protein, partial [Gammaproteobacteria bacterium]|nr:LysR family transcriptional regulator substrate-binding protein [Gammaproteobacteria bacterium]